MDEAMRSLQAPAGYPAVRCDDSEPGTRPAPARSARGTDYRGLTRDGKIAEAGGMGSLEVVEINTALDLNTARRNGRRVDFSAAGKHSLSNN